ncbi:amidohydrolase 2 [[Actinomadura] parvosata subsp. kistnae]|uniref:Amidohydrolase n=1 Tax=[Actinomadura] parvosata subsp. kistnae TaxID=1909395 RepID=A0A1V0AGA0_9ACTN|nr:amidohydrolase [Nonomuraea sp. ATCC 55076]AQZ69213.1 amidohydrolase [Nonomuraea sp. ATCC 55076]SPL92178.1 amidohydrolase 2 [Actinomadura parvosata subsp. kistnae]
MSVDVHQHLWTSTFLDALRARDTPPYLDGWTLILDGEPPYEVDPADHDPSDHERRGTAGLELALVSLSSPLGIEFLPPEESWPLIDAYHDGALALGEPYGAWAATCHSEPDPERLAKDLDRGFAGLQIPATAVPGDELLDVLTERDLPLFVHPGPAPRQERGTPPWWPALVPYVQQMHASWHYFHAVVRPRHPRLRVCFALLAGLAPLHSERLIARGGGRGLVDPGFFVETSSYGPRAIDAIVRELGIDVVVNGSDAPYARAPETGLGAAADHAIKTVNPRRLISGKETRT